MTFDKEKFLTEIHSFPYWVKDELSLMKYCKHLKYRMIQQEEEKNFYKEQCIKHLTDDKILEINNSLKQYDDAYNNHKSEFMRFSEFNERTKTV